MPARHDLDPVAMTDDERRAKRRYQAHFVFETMPQPRPATTTATNESRDQ